MRTSVAVVVTAGVVVAGGAAGTAAALAGSGQRVVVQDVASGSRIVTHPGDRLLLKLTACEGSCGYHWKITDKPDPSVEAFVKRKSSVQDGGNALERWVFKAVADGRTTVTLGYFPPGRNKPAKTRHLVLVVRG